MNNIDYAMAIDEVERNIATREELIEEYKKAKIALANYKPFGCVIGDSGEGDATASDGSADDTGGE